MTATDDPTWDFRKPACKPRLLAVLRREANAMIEIATDPDCWHAPTACPGWEVRDMIGHLIDATEGYLGAFDTVRRGLPPPAAVGVHDMAAQSDRAARAFRSLAQPELLERLRRGTDRLLEEFAGLSDGDWTNLVLPEPYLGPLPAMVIAEGLLGGLAVHTWDVHQGTNSPHAIPADVADLLVPFVFLLWFATADTTAVDTPYSVGIRTTGRNGGDTKLDISRQGLRFARDKLDDCPTIIEFDPGTFVLTGYNRVNAGTIHGDPKLAAMLRSSLIAI